MSRRTLTAQTLRRGINLWPPYLFAGVRVLHLADDWSSARVRLRLHRFNRNYVGTQFGGSLFAMSDPFWMLLAMQRLGRDYIVWDKAGEIDFVSPGRGDVFAEFTLDEDRLDEIRAATADGGKALPWFENDVVAADGTVVARVRKQLYVRRKSAAPARPRSDARG
ncbi:tetrameric acyl-CoA thioesterase [Streptomyces albus subsp. albus]|nr:tetrameric acyl-CoA thioesterase [Streptomyces albus subsp. albus]